MTDETDETLAWAVQDAAGKILIPTVGPTIRSAMINWLVAFAERIVYASWTDEDISGAFDEVAPIEKVSLIRVRISKEH